MQSVSLLSPGQLMQYARPPQAVPQPARPVLTGLQLMQPSQLRGLNRPATPAPPVAATFPQPISPPAALDRFQTISNVLRQRGIPVSLPGLNTPTQPVAPPAMPVSHPPKLAQTAAPVAPAAPVAIPVAEPVSGGIQLPEHPPLPIPRPQSRPEPRQQAQPQSPAPQPLPPATRPSPRPVTSAPAVNAAPKAGSSPIRQPLRDTFVFQFEEIGKKGTAKEAQANCGPASAAMILQALGVKAPSMQDLRRLVNAPTGSRSGPYALSTEQVGKAVEKVAAQKGINVDFEVTRLSTSVDRTQAEIKKRLERGEQVILLSSGLAGLSQGHYMVVKEVRRDGSVVMNDSGRRDGENIVYSKARMAQALRARVNTYGRQNELISFQLA